MESLINVSPNFKTPVDMGYQTGTDEVAKFVDDLVSRLKTARRRYDQEWPRFYDFYFNRQWPERRPKDWKSWLTVNYIFSIIQSIQAQLFDQRPSLEVGATGPEQQPYPHVMQVAVDSVWYRGKFANKVIEAETNALIYGTGILKVYWDPEAENGTGEVKVAIVPTENILMDAEATEVEDAHVIVELRQVPQNYIKRYWPDKAKLVTPERYSNSLRHREWPGSYAVGRLGETDINLVGPLTASYGPLGDNPLVADQTSFTNPPYMPGTGRFDWVTLKEVWIRDESTETIEVPSVEINPVTGETYHVTKFIEKPKYEYGWRIIYVASGITLEDKPAPYPKPPYVRFVDVNRPGEFWGMGEVELLRDLQMELNKRRSQMVDYCVLMGNAVWVVDRESGLDPDSFNNKPGLVIFKKAGTEARREPPPPMPTWMYQALDLAIRDMREISGVSAIPGGLPPKGVRSGSGFQAAMDIANSRIRAKARNLETSLEQVGQHIIRLIQLFYTTPRMVRILGEAGQTIFIPYGGDNLRGDWDLHVEASSAIQQSRQTKVNQALELFKMGVIDQQAVLDAVDFPQKSAVMRRMNPMAMPSMWPNYPGWPGQANHDTTDQSGYGLGVRHLVPQEMQGAPMPGGTNLPSAPFLPAVGGSPEQSPSSGMM